MWPLAVRAQRATKLRATKLIVYFAPAKTSSMLSIRPRGAGCNPPSWLFTTADHDPRYTLEGKAQRQMGADETRRPPDFTATSDRYC